MLLAYQLGTYILLFYLLLLKMQLFYFPIYTSHSEIVKKKIIRYFVIEDLMLNDRTQIVAFWSRWYHDTAKKA